MKPRRRRIMKAMPFLLLALLCQHCSTAFQLLQGENPRANGGEEKPLERIDFQCHPFASNDAGTTIAYLTDHALIRRRGKGKTILSFQEHSCLNEKADLIYLFPDGETALVYGTRSNMPLDLWGHSGHRVSVNCLVDFKNKTTAPFELPADAPRKSYEMGIRAGHSLGRLYFWSKYSLMPSSGVVVFDLTSKREVSLPTGSFIGSYCDLIETPSRLLLACFSSGDGATPKQEISLQEFSVESWPPKLVQKRVIPLAGQLEPRLLTFSSDGRWIAYRMTRDIKAPEMVVPLYEHHFGLIEVESLKNKILLRETVKGFVHDFTFDPQVKTLLVGTEEPQGPSPRSSVRIRGMDLEGQPLWEVTRKELSPPRKLFGSATGDHFWHVGSCEANALSIPQR